MAVSLVYVCVSVTVFDLISIIYFYMSLLSFVYVLLFLFIYICCYFNFMCVRNRRGFPQENSSSHADAKETTTIFPRAFTCESVLLVVVLMFPRSSTVNLYVYYRLTCLCLVCFCLV